MFHRIYNTTCYAIKTKSFQPFYADSLKGSKKHLARYPITSFVKSNPMKKLLLFACLLGLFQKE